MGVWRGLGGFGEGWEWRGRERKGKAGIWGFGPPPRKILGASLVTASKNFARSASLSARLLNVVLISRLVVSVPIPHMEAYIIIITIIFFRQHKYINVT